MPDLMRSLQGRDLGHLRIVAGLWGETLEAADLRSALQRLPDLLLRPEVVAEVVETLPAEAHLALEELAAAGGKLPWPVFSRRFGRLREMGPGKRDREHPERDPESPAEVLWYRALVARAFFDTPNGPEEQAYIPEDLLALLPESIVARSAPAEPLGRVASPVERAQPLPASDRLLDAACTLLAALRLGLPTAEIQSLEAGWHFPGGAPLTVAALSALLEAAGLLDAGGLPLPEPARLFLEAPRAQALLLLLLAWINSPTVNDLRLTPGLRSDGEWSNDPLRARQAALDFLSSVPGCRAAISPGVVEERPYWSLSAFIQAVHRRYPDFQRPAGDYDSWYIRASGSDEFLRGFEHWDDVDGALLRYLICGPLHWLGILELAAPASASLSGPQGAAAAFRASAWAGDLLAGRAPTGLPAEDAAIQVRSDFRIFVPRLAPRSLRYQLARFAIWEAAKEDEYRYRLTPAALLRAQRQGLNTNHLLALLRRCTRTLPPNLTRSLERWERQGTEARIQPLMVLRLSNPDLLQTLRASKSARFLGDPLGPTAVIVKPGAAEKVLAALAEMGILGEATLED